MSKFDAKAFLIGCMKSHPITEPATNNSTPETGQRVGDSEISFRQRVRVLTSEGVKPDQFCVMSTPSLTSVDGGWSMVFLTYTNPQSDQMERPTVAIIPDKERQLYHRRYTRWLADELKRLESLHL